MTSEDSVRQLIHTLRQRSKFEGSDLALLHKQQAEICSSVWSFALTGLIAGTLLSSDHFGMVSIVLLLCCLGFLSFYIYRLTVYSAAVSFLISRSTFDLS